MILSRYRKTVDTIAPPLGRSYRLLRDATNRRRSLSTPFGFTLAGDPNMASDGWEVREIERFLKLLESHDTVIDIGANIGFYSCLAANRGKHAVAFEPAARNLRYLYKNLGDNQFSSVEVFPLGLGSRCGLAKIYGFGGIASFVPGWAQSREAQATVVPLTTLDTVLGGRFGGEKLLIKMDVEGFELDVLAGAAETLRRTPKPTWMVEILLRDEVIPEGISHKFAATFEMFWRHGYRSQALDAAQTPVALADVSRWVATGIVDSQTHDFLFCAG